MYRFLFVKIEAIVHRRRYCIKAGCFQSLSGLLKRILILNGRRLFGYEELDALSELN